MKADKVRQQGSLSGTVYTPPQASQPRTEDQAFIAQQTDSIPWWRTTVAMMVAAFVLLLLIVLLLVVFNKPPTLEAAKTASILNAESETKAEDAPWQRQQQVGNRFDAQELLADLFDLKRTLEAKSVQQWGANEYALALAAAEQGDDEYQLGNFVVAKQSYERALTQLKDLEQQIDQVASRLTTAGNQALAEAKSTLALEKFRQALQLNSNYIPALTGLARAEKLPQVLELKAQANSLIQRFNDHSSSDDLEQAIAVLDQALAIDDQFESTTVLRNTALQQLQQHRFQSAMSTALNALLSQQYGQAQKGFAQALEIYPDDEVAKNGLQQALALNRGSSLVSLFRQAEQFEQSEQWQQALSTYEAILARDASQVRARSALVQARIRARLDRELVAVLNDPMVVTQADTRKKVEQLQSDAQSIQRPGERLTKQLTALDSLLSGVNKTRPLVLASDGATVVTLSKRGSKPIRYEPFVNKTLALPPGSYVVTGQRVGFQDVRHEVEISPLSSQGAELEVRCTLKLVTGG